MGRMNLDPLATFPDGSQLLVSTQSSREGRFTCELYVASPGTEGSVSLRVISNHYEASTCLEAQEIAYSQAQRLYPGTADGMKKPPYLIWHGPVLSA
ncbi:MAG TPA: hypothetical protein VFL31_00760 [Nitrospiraceae bacterium]|nr:hypothetical protein [Nitrospiraceae bacterium]